MKKIIFSNSSTLSYIDALSIDRDFKNGYTRPSIEVKIPFSATSFDEIYNLSNKGFKLIGEPNEEGEIPTSEWYDYTIRGKITVEDDVITFKCYKLSDSELAIDELLLKIAMEG